ncbi:aldose 1-epimerase [Thalassotalea piscium]
MNKVTLAGHNQELVICPELGGSVLAYNVTVAKVKRTILRDSTQAKAVLDTCNFPLVPYSNRIKKGSFPWQGQLIKLPLNFSPETGTIHGHGWEKNWQIVSQTAEKLVIEYNYQADEWPFDYHAEQVFELTETGLINTLSIKNLSDKPMPTGLGFHPYFFRTPLCKMSVDAEKMWAVDSECLPTQLVDIPEGLNDKTGRVVNSLAIDNCLTGFKKHACITWPEWQVKTEIIASSACDFVVVYSPENENFVCIEPVTHCTDAFNMQANNIENTGTVSLPGHETMTISMALHTSELI